MKRIVFWTGQLTMTLLQEMAMVKEQMAETGQIEMEHAFFHGHYIVFEAVINRRTQERGSSIVVVRIGSFERDAVLDVFILNVFVMIKVIKSILPAKIDVNHGIHMSNCVMLAVILTYIQKIYH